MSDGLIKKSDAIEVAKAFWYKPDIAGALAELPAIEPKRGENLKSDYPSLFECSVCGASCDDTIPWDCDINFCPNCGAQMKGADDE